MTFPISNIDCVLLQHTSAWVYEKKFQIGEGMVLTNQLLRANNKGPLKQMKAFKKTQKFCWGFRTITQSVTWDKMDNLRNL